MNTVKRLHSNLTNAVDNLLTHVTNEQTPDEMMGKAKEPTWHELFARMNPTELDELMCKLIRHQNKSLCYEHADFGPPTECQP